MKGFQNEKEKNVLKKIGKHRFMKTIVWIGASASFTSTIGFTECFCT